MNKKCFYNLVYHLTMPPKVPPEALQDPGPRLRTINLVDDGRTLWCCPLLAALHNCSHRWTGTERVVNKQEYDKSHNNNNMFNK